MEMERINEHTIRIMIANEDLEARGISFLDLLGSHKEVEAFFYSILDEVDAAEEFRKSDAITFQVMPNRHGIELFISDNGTEGFENWERMNDSVDEDHDASYSDGTNEFFAPDESSEEYSSEEQQGLNRSPIVIAFDDFELLIELARQISSDELETQLYEKKGTYYFIAIPPEAIAEGQLLDLQARLLEFGDRSKITVDLLQEYADPIIEHDALNVLRKHFC